MTMYTKLTSVLTKNPRLSRNTIALGGLLSAVAVTTSRDKNESNDDDECKLRFHKTKLTPLFPEPSNATKTTDCDFSTPRFNSIRRRRTTQQMEDEAHETKLEYVYDVNWAEPLGEGGFGAVYLGREYKSGDFGT